VSLGARKIGKHRRINNLSHKAMSGDTAALDQLRAEYPDSYFFYFNGLILFWNNWTAPIQVMPTGLHHVASYIEVFGPDAQVLKDKENQAGGRFKNRLSLKMIPDELVLWAVMAS
jgi:hypothetical protein